MNDVVSLWEKLDALDKANDLDGVLALGELPEFASDPRYARYVAWAFTERDDFLSAGRWYAKAYSLGASESEGEFRKCLQALYQAGNAGACIELMATSPMDALYGTHRTMFDLQFATKDWKGLLQTSQRLAEFGGPEEIRFAGEMFLSEGDAPSAFPYIKLAAESGDDLASQLLGEMYLRGLGVPQSDTAAVQSYERPARAGFILSRSRLAHLKRRENRKWMDFAFILSMTRIIVHAMFLRFVRPSDVRLKGVP